MTLNRAQRLVAALTGSATALAALFPPWIAAIPGRPEWFYVGHDFLFGRLFGPDRFAVDDQETSTEFVALFVRVDAPLLGLDLVVIGLIGLCAVLALRDVKP